MYIVNQTILVTFWSIWLINISYTSDMSQKCLYKMESRISFLLLYMIDIYMYCSDWTFHHLDLCIEIELFEQKL